MRLRPFFLVTTGVIADEGEESVSLFRVTETALRLVSVSSKSRDFQVGDGLSLPIMPSVSVVDLSNTNFSGTDSRRESVGNTTGRACFSVGP